MPRRREGRQEERKEATEERGIVGGNYFRSTMIGTPDWGFMLVNVGMLHIWRMFRSQPRLELSILLARPGRHKPAI